MRFFENELDNLKKQCLDMRAKERLGLYEKPELIYLFFELTENCNEHCFHCGSFCEPGRPSGLDLETYEKVLLDVKKNLDMSKVQLCITGGEPLLRPDFFQIMNMAVSHGFHWGMTTNGTLITKDVARKLREAEMRTVSISIDGLESTHDRQRGLPGGYKKAMEGIENLIAEDYFQHIQVTTVVNHQNIGELDQLFEIINPMDIDSWRVIGMEPMGRALQYPEYLLTDEDQKKLFSFIYEKRRQDIPVKYGCSHFLGLPLEREVREWFFLCGAGIHTASIRANGDITACLDIEEREEFVFGNVLKDSFSEVWLNEFKPFRQPLSERTKECRECEYEKWCAGGAHHSFDYDNDKQRICFKGVLFE